MSTRAELARSLHFAVGPLRDGGEPNTGPLAGRRLIVKDLFDVAGEPTGAGCDTPIVERAAATASAVQRLVEAGAVYVGKAQMVQLAFGGWGANACVGPPRNPWDATGFRVAGGSSSGSAVAVASGFADLALGSDTGGSIRIPASLCGVVGLKPTHGRIAMDGVVPLASSLDSVGPMARNVADVAAAFAVLAGETPVAGPARLDRLMVRTLRDEDLAADADVADVYRAVVERIGTAGAAVRAEPLPTSPGDYVAPAGQVMGHEAWALHGARVIAARHSADPGVLRRFEAAATIDAAAYRRAQAARDLNRQRFAAWFEDADILVTPTTPRTAPLIEDVDEADFTLAHYTRMANYLGLCAVSVPCGFDRLGLPIGLQLIGKAGAETGLIAAAWRIERMLALAPRAPPLHASRCAEPSS